MSANSSLVPPQRQAELPRGRQALHSSVLAARGAGGWLGLVVTIATTLLFVAAANRAFTGGYLAPLLGVVWDVETNAGGQSVGGHWLEQGLLALVQTIPNGGPELLVLLTSLVTGLAIGQFCRTLQRRGWPISLATLAGLLVALHPVTLYLASSGQPMVFAAMSIAILLVSVDRAAALSDAQSLMTLGLAFALLFLIEPNALYMVLPVLAIMPWVLVDMRDGISGAALFLILIVPSIVVIATLLAGSLVVGVAPETILRHWLAVLHGSLSEDSLGATWMSERGGTFFDPLLDLLGLAFGCCPVLILVLWRLLASPLFEPRRPHIRTGTAVLAVALAPLAGAMAVLFWHQQTRMAAVAITIAAVCAWTTTVSLRMTERGVWLLALLLGVVLSWQASWLWVDADKLAWRSAVLGG